MCLYPTIIKNRKYTKTKKNNGMIPPCKDLRTLYVPIGCQQCMECTKQKARSCQTRLLEDIKVNKNAHFITLTFSNDSYAQLNHEIPTELEGYERDNAVATMATRRFLERWRKKYKRSLRHWAVTELGHNGTENIHLHAVVWTTNPQEIAPIWNYGYVFVGTYVNERTINYITKYVTKLDHVNKTYKSKILTSPGIGQAYTLSHNSKRNAYKQHQTEEYYRTRTGHKIALPIYWRNKIYTEDQRESLWIEKLNKKERWVNKVKISIAKDEKAYYRELETARKLNRQLGYGTSHKDWSRETYERQRRNLIIKTRIQNAEKG